MKQLTCQPIMLRRRQRQRGIATVMVLSMLLVLSFLAVHVISVTRITAREAVVNRMHSRQRLVAESASDRAFWLLLCDTRAWPNRALGDDLAARKAGGQGPDEDAWMADGRAHQWQEDGFAVEVKIVDAMAGLDLSSGADAIRQQLQDPEGKYDEELEWLLDAFADAADVDDLRRVHGREKGEYTADGWNGLPRNAPMQLVEEIFWLPEFADWIRQNRPDDAADPARLAAGLRLIAPPGVPSPGQGQPSLFNTPVAWIVRQLGLTADEGERLRLALDQWQRDGTPLRDTLSPDLIGRLQGRYSLNESGVCTFQVTTKGLGGEIQSRLIATRNLNGYQTMTPPRMTLVYWQFWRP